MLKPASRRFVRRTRAALGELMGRPVPDDLVVLMLDGGDTCPELAVRRELHRRGMRYRVRLKTPA